MYHCTPTRPPHPPSTPRAWRPSPSNTRLSPYRTPRNSRELRRPYSRGQTRPPPPCQPPTRRIRRAQPPINTKARPRLCKQNTTSVSTYPYEDKRINSPSDTHVHYTYHLTLQRVELDHPPAGGAGRVVHDPPRRLRPGAHTGRGDVRPTPGRRLERTFELGFNTGDDGHAL